MMKRRLQRKFEFERTELPAVLAKRLFRLNGACFELPESAFSSDDTGASAIKATVHDAPRCNEAPPHSAPPVSS